MKTAFVVMSFSDSHDRVYHQAIKPALEDIGYHCFRADDDAGPGNIPAEIVRALISSDVVIADVTEPSPNVYYELGISHCLGNKTVTITRDASSLPFDIRVFRAIEYEGTTAGLRLLKTDIKSVVKALESRSGDGGLNLVQDAGREHFNLQDQIRKNLQEVRDERERLKAYAAFQERRRKGELEDNSGPADQIASHVAMFAPRPDHRLLICICGSGAIGKSVFSHLLAERIKNMYQGRFTVGILATDSYMLSRADRLARNILGFDPRSHDLPLLVKDIEALLIGKEITVRPYDHRTGEHAEAIVVEPKDIMIVEGIYAFHPPLAPLSHSLRYYIYADPLRARELKFISDVTERDHDLQTAFLRADAEYQAYACHVLPSLNFSNFVLHVEGYWKYSNPAPAADILHARAIRYVPL